MDSLPTLDSFEQLYAAAAGGAEEAVNVLRAHQFYYALAAAPPQEHDGQTLAFVPQQVHDSRTADTQPVSLENVLTTLILSPPQQEPGAGRDRFTFIMHYVGEVLPGLLAAPREKIVREEKMQPAHRVRQLTPAGMLHINRQAGETARQKLRACRDGIPAIVRCFSLDSAENRILKRFTRNALALCDQRELAFGEEALPPEELALSAAMMRWLKEEAVQEIRPGATDQPNNVVLGDARYNRVWRGLAMLSDIDEALQQDLANLSTIRLNQAAWQLFAELYQRGAQYPQVPVFFNDADLMASPLFPGCTRFGGQLQGKPFKVSWAEGALCLHWGELSYRWELGAFCPSELPEAFPDRLPQLPHQHPHPESGEHAVVDFCTASPWHCCGSTPAPLPFVPRMQFWQSREEETMALDLCSADAASLHPNSPVLCSSNLFDEETDEEQRQALAECLAERLRRRLGERDFTFLLPDDADDFSASTLRSAFRLCFAHSTPRSLPTGVAAAIGYATRHRVKRRTQLMVVTRSHRSLILSPIEADTQVAAYAAASPGGLRWTRHPFSLRERTCECESLSPRGKVLFFAQASKAPFGPPPPLSPDEEAWLHEEAARRAGDAHYEILIDPEPSLLSAGARACATFDAQPDLPRHATLWKDHLPSLHMVATDSHLADTTFTLVSPRTTISPRQRNARIEIDSSFQLPAGQKEYSFPLLMGEGGSHCRYSMRLRSRLFPLAESLTCSLELDYSYGEPHPYRLRFVGLNGWPEFEAEWHAHKPNRERGDIPPEPQPASLDELHRFTNLGSLTQNLNALALCGKIARGVSGIGRIVLMQQKDEAPFCGLEDCLSATKHTQRFSWLKEGDAVFYFMQDVNSVTLFEAQRGTIIRQHYDSGSYIIRTTIRGEEKTIRRQDGTAPDFSEGDEVYMYYIKQENHTYLRHTDELPERIHGISLAIVDSVDAAGNAIIINEQNGDKLKAYNRTQSPLAVGLRVWYWDHTYKTYQKPRILRLAPIRRTLGDIAAAGPGTVDTLPKPLIQAAHHAKANIERLLVNEDKLLEKHRHSLAAIALTLGSSQAAHSLSTLQSLLQEQRELRELRAKARFGSEARRYELIDWLLSYSDCIGLAQEKWQQELAHELLRLRGNTAKTLRSWKKILWRAPGVVPSLTPPIVASILSYLESLLSLAPPPLSGNSLKNPAQANPILVYCAEIILALLRARGSSDRQLSKGFSLAGPLTARCRSMFNTIIKRFVEADVYFNVHSTLRLDNLPGMGNYPALLYALRQYLTGENPMGAVRIISSDDEDDDDDDDDDEQDD